MVAAPGWWLSHHLDALRGLGADVSRVLSTLPDETFTTTPTFTLSGADGRPCRFAVHGEAFDSVSRSHARELLRGHVVRAIASGRSLTVLPAGIDTLIFITGDYYETVDLLGEATSRFDHPLTRDVLDALPAGVVEDVLATHTAVGPTGAIAILAPYLDRLRPGWDG